jgi:hypothetical protein
MVRRGAGTTYLEFLRLRAVSIPGRQPEHRPRDWLSAGQADRVFDVVGVGLLEAGGDLVALILVGR